MGTVKSMYEHCTASTRPYIILYGMLSEINRVRLDPMGPDMDQYSDPIGPTSILHDPV